MNRSALKSLNQRYEVSEAKERQMNEFLKNYPSTQNILNRARSDMKSLGDVSTIKLSRDIKKFQSSKDLVSLDVQKQINQTYKNIQYECLPQLNKKMDQKIISHRRQLEKQFTDQIRGIHTKLTTITREHYQNGQDGETLKEIAMKKTQRDKLSILINKLDIKIHEMKGELGIQRQLNL